MVGQKRAMRSEENNVRTRLKAMSSKHCNNMLNLASGESVPMADGIKSLETSKCIQEDVTEEFVVNYFIKSKENDVRVTQQMKPLSQYAMKHSLKRAA